MVTNLVNRYRKFVTSSVGFSFLVVGTTGVIFKFFFKNHVLENIHGWLGIAMVAAALFHIFQNWPSLRNHFRDPRVFGLLLPIVLLMVFFALRPEEPKSGLNLREVTHKLSLGKSTDVAQAFGKDLGTITSAMALDGVHIKNPSQTIGSIAQDNHKSPDFVLAYFIK
jgi:hypothetical protein